MNLILVGLSGRDQMAFDLFLKRSMPSWHWRSVSAIKGQSLPAADVLIVDLTACGWSQRSDDNYAALKQVVWRCCWFPAMMSPGLARRQLLSLAVGFGLANPTTQNPCALR